MYEKFHLKSLFTEQLQLCSIIDNQTFHWVFVLMKVILAKFNSTTFVF